MNFKTKKPILICPHTPISNRVVITNLSTFPDNCALTPAFARPSCNVAPGIGTFTEKDAVHVLPTLWDIPNSVTHAR